MDEKNDSAGKKALEDTKVLISDGLFINIDYVTLMDVDGFEDIVESIDGVELDITASVTYFDGEKEEEVTVSEGKQTVRGDMVRPIVMLDDVDEITIDRTDMQNRFIKSFVAKLQKTVGIDNLKKLMEIFEIVSKSVVTDMTMDDLLSFMKTMLQYDGTSTVILTMPTQVCGDYFIMNKAATLDIINRYFNTFDKEIPSKYFDQNCRFCDKTDEDAMSIYSAAPDKLSPENGFIPDVAK